MSLTLLEEVGTVLSSIQTPLIFYASEPQTPLDLVLLLALNEAPARAAGGTFDLSTGAAGEIAEGLAEGGWLEGWLDALEAATEPPPEQPDRKGRDRKNRPEPPALAEPLSLALAFTPRTLEEIDDLSDGFPRADAEPIDADAATPRAAASFIDRLGTLLADRPTVVPVLTPYAFPDLPTLVREGPFEHTFDHLRLGQTVLAQTIDVDVDETWLFPPAGRLDSSSLEQIQRWGASRTFLSPKALVPSATPEASGCPEPILSFTCPISVPTLNGPVKGYVADTGLTERLGALQTQGEDRLLLQRFFAETVLIREEIPNIGGRVVHTTVPSLWHPHPRMAQVFLKGLQEAPWLRTVTPDEGLASDAVEKQIVDDAASIASAPAPEYFDLLEDAGRVIESYGSTLSPESERLLLLRRNILAAESRSLWRDEGAGESIARASSEEAASEMAKVTLEGAPEITLTSRKGELPIVLSNGADYPVDIEIELVSDNLAFNETTIRDTFEPGRHPLTLEATARASGAFPLRVLVHSPDGEYEIASKDILIRSTSLNQIALAITIGALVFLVLFYASRPFRRRKKRESAA